MAGSNTGSFIKHLPQSSSVQTAVFLLYPRGKWIKLANLSIIKSESFSGRGETECLTKRRSNSKPGHSFNAFYLSIVLILFHLPSGRYLACLAWVIAYLLFAGCRNHKEISWKCMPWSLHKVEFRYFLKVLKTIRSIKEGRASLQRRFYIYLPLYKKKAGGDFIDAGIYQ